jgi:hypothetical protein
MKFFLILIATILALFLCSQLQAAVPDGTMISAAILSPIARWVENASHMRIHSLPIVTASGFRLKTSLGLEGVQQARSIAAYIPGQIIINNIVWDPESLRAQSYLVHEMVHHAQTLSGRTYPCHNAKEREAYILQNQWLAEHGESPLYNQYWINEFSACR